MLFNLYDFIVRVLCGAILALVVINIDVAYRVYLYNKRIKNKNIK